MFLSGHKAAATFAKSTKETMRARKAWLKTQGKLLVPLQLVIKHAISLPDQKELEFRQALQAYLGKVARMADSCYV